MLGMDPGDDIRRAVAGTVKIFRHANLNRRETREEGHHALRVWRLRRAVQGRAPVGQHHRRREHRLITRQIKPYKAQELQRQHPLEGCEHSVIRAIQKFRGRATEINDEDPGDRSALERSRMRDAKSSPRTWVTAPPSHRHN